MTGRLLLLIVVAVLAVYSCVLPGTGTDPRVRAGCRAVLLAIVLYLAWSMPWSLTR